ncbi:xanthine dehydrogenase family protein molybdopterin-binding subunit [Actinacidiphila oryziradicis]|jgi:xanthine dehydrogenase YagR molybdenum-binding subunit|uniref:Xanthine dehydrogenase family protein molybdopterin-binding subunit n=1 Tax=Actinacidiphila oryziradicis TaxID=2571141 RepID=A0A4U0SXD3_9ACTN|nr:xanthine dehydrogenase family protein molybdopterin-binding subunit [Actinacidiphila oryziradicis]MCW2874582.1 oxidoreductase [Actinacidiphila oryziradicis]TKA12767.1 xanthine dehydrogenase family protein molybdopterin-binding subunit [Actinacidiphila oryziradicis]
MTTTSRPALGAPAARIESREKVTGAARYAADHTPPGTRYAWPVPATVAKGEITAVRTAAALSLPGALAVLTHADAPRLSPDAEPDLAVLQSPQVSYRGQIVALAIADTLETARAMAAAVEMEYARQPHDVTLTEDHPGLHTPEQIGVGDPPDRVRGDAEAAWAAAPVRIEATYRIPPLHNHPMEPHASVAVWEGDRLTVHDSNQGSTRVQQTLAGLFGIPPEQITVISEHIGGGFGSKGTPRQHVVLAAMAARHTGRTVKLVLPRQCLPAITGHRAPTIQRVRLGADRDGRLTSVCHEVVTHSSTVSEFVEAAAISTRVLYAHPASRTTHRVTLLDVPVNSWMRAPGECPGMFALESAMDELALAAGLDPVELRLRNDTATDPDSGLPFSSRHLAECLREGALRFGWHDRDPRPAVRRQGPLLTGTGVAAATYPARAVPSTAEARVEPDGSTYTVRINASDIGTGARTVLAQAAADTLGVAMDCVRIQIGRSDLPAAPLAGGSHGTASWSWAVVKACRALLDAIPRGGTSATADTTDDINAAEGKYAQQAFGAQFAEVQVDTETGEARVRRLLGVFAVGRVLNPRTARSQLVGAMAMGLSMALLEDSHLDPAFGDFAERDLASYHFAACADVRGIEAHWIDEDDPHLGPLGVKGLGEIGIVGTAAAIANAVHHATGVRVRDLPLRPDTLLRAIR